MRAIFILLLAANLAFFAYEYLFAVKDEAKVSAEVVGYDGGLRLLAEQKSAPRMKTKTESELKVQSAAVDHRNAETELCTMIGPYGQLLQAEYAVERLVALGVVARITPVEINEGESYWVYLRPEVSENEALRRLHELQKKNIESHVITKGELTNGISFGRFADYPEAEALLAKIEKEGYEVNIKRLPKVIQETWVVIDAGYTEKIDETVWADLLSKQSLLEKRQNFCLGVASQ